MLVDLSVKVPKELNEVRVALIEIVRDLKAKKDLATVGGENLSNLLKAIEGVDQIPQEVRESLAESAVCGGILGGELVGALLAK